jgi:hypothetical protein
MGDSDICVSLLHHFHNQFTLIQLCDLFCYDSIPFIVSELYRLNISDLDTISISVLFHILSHHSLILSSEDELYSYLISLVFHPIQNILICSNSFASNIFRQNAFQISFHVFPGSLTIAFGQQFLFDYYCNNFHVTYNFHFRRPNHVMASFHILRGNTVAMFTTKELSQLHQSRLMMIGLGRLSPIPFLAGVSTQVTSQVNGFAGISTNCASSRLITQLGVAVG